MTPTQYTVTTPTCTRTVEATSARDAIRGLMAFKKSVRVTPTSDPACFNVVLGRGMAVMVRAVAL